MLSVYSTAPRKVLLLCRNAVGVFYKPKEGLIPHQRCCRCILQPQGRSYPSSEMLLVYSTTPRKDLSLIRDAVGVFYSPKEGPIPHQRCCRCILQPQRRSYPSSEMVSVYSTTPRKVLSLIRDALGVFYSPKEGLIPHQRCCRCILQLQGRSYCSAEMLSVYSTNPRKVLSLIRDAVGVFFNPKEGLIPHLRCCSCILQPQPTGLEVDMGCLKYQHLI